MDCFHSNVNQKRVSFLSLRSLWGLFHFFLSRQLFSLLWRFENQAPVLAVTLLLVLEMLRLDFAGPLFQMALALLLCSSTFSIVA